MDFKDLGYSKEEEFFYKENQKLIEKNRQENDKVRKETEEKNKAHGHWMKCPKCGDSLEEKNLFNILIDQCVSCQGIYLDKGELETLLESEKHDGLFLKLRSLFP